MKYLNKIVKKLIKKNISVAIAESCTGGLLSYTFVKNKGISKIYKTGIICYSNNSKIKNLGIGKSILNKHGAVSKEIAKQMIDRLYKKEKCVLSISTTGIAGPSGGSEKKPVGLVFIGIKYNLKNYLFKKKFQGTRYQIQRKTVEFIFYQLNKLIE